MGAYSLPADQWSWSSNPILYPGISVTAEYPGDAKGKLGDRHMILSGGNPTDYMTL